MLDKPYPTCNLELEWTWYVSNQYFETNNDYYVRDDNSLRKKEEDGFEIAC